MRWGESKKPLVINVVLNSSDLGSNAEIFVEEVERDCSCTLGNWPHAGTCEGYNDGIFCSCSPLPGPGPGSCLDRIRIERGGVVLFETTNASIGPIWALPIPGLYEHNELELVIEGCFAATRIPLPTSAPEPSRVDRIATQDGDLRVDWTGAGDETNALVYHGRLGGALCNDDTPGRAVVSAPEYFGSGINITTKLLRHTSHATSIGTVNIWQGKGHSVRDVRNLRQREDGEWQLGEIGAPLLDATIGYQGSIQDWRGEATFDLSTGEPLLRLRSWDGIELRYEQGLPTDRITLLNWDYTTEIPHVPMTGRLGQPEGLSIKLDLPPTTFTRADGDTIERRIGFHIDFGVVAEPVQ